jgi:FG-GAP-like repeat
MIRLPRTLFLAAAIPVLSAAAQFERAVYYPGGKGVFQFSVISAVFTSSNNADLAFADFYSSQVRLLLGNGEGTFQKGQTLPVPTPSALAAGDFDEDGNMDVAVIEFGGTGRGYLGIFLGNGDGTFRKGARYELGVQSGYIALADFNGDGHLDVAVTNGGEGKGNVMVFFGTGNGTFHAPTTYKLTSASAIAAGDLDNDHYPDLVIGQFSTGSVAVLMNDGNGRFGKPVSYDAGGGEVVDVKIGDLRHDGRNDLVVANASLSAVGVLLNSGDGTFGEVKLYPTHCAVEALTLADFNSDGKLDVAVAANVDNSAFMYGKGNGSFGSPIPIEDAIGGDGGYSIISGDFNSDGAPDLAIPIEDKGKVAILLNTK